MLSTIGGYLVDLGLDISRDKIIGIVQEKQVRNRLEDFIQRQSKFNFSCTIEEEIDFGALSDYLRTELIDDVRVRMRGTKAERTQAHNSIIGKVRTFAKAKTKLGEKRALEMATKAMEILRVYYRNRINAELLFLAAEIEDTVIAANEHQHAEQTQIIVDEMTHQRELTIASVSEMLQFSPERVIADGIRMVEAGDISTIERLATSYTNAMSTQHTLFPHYGFDFRLHQGAQRLTSIPLTADAEKQYPPKFKCVGTIKVGDLYVDELSPALFDYANRHQLPLQLNIKQAQKLLGTEPDPIQYEAEEWEGKTLTVPPRPFREAFPCAISLNNTVVFDYVLFRTQEILDDGTVVISNREQSNYPFAFTMKANLRTKRLTFTVALCEASNADTLKYIRFMSRIGDGSVISVKSLELQEEFARGRLDDFHYQPGFDSVEEEIHFWEMIVAVEKHFNTTIDTPIEIYESDYNLLQYLYCLIIGDTNIISWSTLSLCIDLNEKLKTDISGWSNSPFALAYVGTVEVPLWGTKYEVPIVRRYLSVKPKDLERLKKKAEILEVGEEIRLDFIPGEGEQGEWEDKAYCGSVGNFPNDVQLIP